MFSKLQIAKETPASAVIGQRISLTKKGSNFLGCCPFHNDSNPSLYVFPDSNRYWCFGCDAGGDAIDFVMKYDGCAFGEAIDRITSGLSDRPPPLPVSKGTKDTADNSKFARDLWASGRSIIGTPAETYLRNRGIRLDKFNHPIPLRFDYLTHWESRQRHPALLSKLEDNEGNITAIQRTFLTEDGWKMPRIQSKLSLGRITGCATKLAPANDEIVICEGLEDGLSVQMALPGVAVWVAAGASNLAKVILPQECRRITIAADNDEAGYRAAVAACECYSDQGFDARIIHPDHQYKDFNEQLQKEQCL